MKIKKSSVGAQSRPQGIALRLHPEQFDLWNRFVDESPQGDVFCYSWWLNAITNGDFKILAVFEKDEIVAGIPLAYYFGKINEPPLTRTLGPLYQNLDTLSEHDQITQQRKWLNALLDQIPFDEFEQFCTSHNFTDWLPFRWRGFKQNTRYTYLIHYSGKTPDEIRQSFNNRKKALIIKAQKNKLRVELSDDFNLFYRLVEQSYARQNLKFRFPIEDFRLLDDVIDKNNKRRIFIAFDEERQAHAAIYIVYNNNSAYYLLSGSNPALRNLGGATLALWEAIKYFQPIVKVFNFGGSDIEKIENYVRGFGGELHQYFHIYKEHPLIKKVQVIKEIPVISEIHVALTPPADDWKYHTGKIFYHVWVLIRKALYKIRIRWGE